MGSGAAWIDDDLDGRLDLFLIHNEDVTESAGLTNASWSVTAAFLDDDRDGWLDLVDL